MSLLAHYLCDNQDNPSGAGSKTMADVSGHANNHDATITIYNTTEGFDHLMIDALGNVYSASEPANPSDFRLQGDMTVCCWIERALDLVAGAYPTAVGSVIGYGDTTHETQAENFQWQLDIVDQGRFRLWWEEGLGVDVIANSPVGAMDPDSDGFGGATHCMHIACIRTVSGTASVKFVVNGVDLGADVTGLTPPDGGTHPDAGPWLFALPRTTNDNRIPARLGSIRVYDSAESVATLLGIYNAEQATFENGNRLGNPLPLLDGYELGGEQGNLYLPRHTGTELDVDGNILAGWESELV